MTGMTPIARYVDDANGNIVAEIVATYRTGLRVVKNPAKTSGRSFG